MKMRKFRDTGIETSLLGLGCMRFPTVNKKTQEIDFKKAEEIIDYAYNNGVNYFDTAYIYNDGDSEKVLGKVLKKYDRKTFYVADKFPEYKIICEEDKEKLFSHHFERLQMDYIDFYLCHAMDSANLETVRKYDVYNFLNGKKKEGKIRFLGFSFHDKPEVFEEICKSYKWDFCQIQLNYFDYKEINAKKLLEIADKYNLPVVVMEPVRGGLLADFGEDINQKFYDFNKEKSVASYALRYVAGFKSVLTVLSGMSSMEQIKENIETMNNFEPLTKDEENLCMEVADIYREKVAVPCTSCRYCSVCPEEIDIPKFFETYNQYKRDNAPWLLKFGYLEAIEKTRANRCIGCGACESICPQHFEIPKKIREFEEKIKAL
jgi:predicted aldo/keto reductase-like oxidoreductase